MRSQAQAAQTVQPATPPTLPVDTRSTGQLAVGALLGIVFVVAAAFAFRNVVLLRFGQRDPAVKRRFLLASVCAVLALVGTVASQVV